MLFVHFLPKSVQVIIYRVISAVFLVPAFALVGDKYYIPAGIALLASLLILFISFVAAKQARAEAEAERQNLHAAATGKSFVPSQPVPSYPSTVPENVWTKPRIGALIALSVIVVGIRVALLFERQFNPRYRAGYNASVTSEAATNTNAETIGRFRRVGQRSSVEKRVLALYYPWYETPQISHRWAHYGGVETSRKRIGSHTHYPASGPYDSRDPAALDRHLKQAAAAGIDTLVCSWWGPKDPTDRALRILLARAAKTNVKVCVLWEQPAQPANRQTLDKEFGYLLTTFGKQSAYLKVQGKPVVFVFDRVGRSVPAYRWPTIQEDVREQYAPGALVIGDGTGTENLTVWDGQFTLGAASFLEGGQNPEVCARAQHDGYAAALQTARDAQRISVVTVAPGYDDRKANAHAGQPANAVADRQEGRLYAGLWQQAIADKPDWILVNSFNQWHAGTEIEPSAELGDTYLKLTQQYAAQFKRNATH